MADLDKYLEDLGINIDEKDFSPATPSLDGESDNESVHQDALIITPPQVEGTPQEKCRYFLSQLLFIIDPNYRVEIRQSASGDLKVGIHGGDSARLIGKNGCTLAALEYLTNVVINRDLDDNKVRVILDISNYRRHREKRLRETARKLVAQVRKTGNALELEPMAANERRIIHLEVSEQQGATSESIGEGKYRRVIVKPIPNKE